MSEYDTLGNHYPPLQMKKDPNANKRKEIAITNELLNVVKKSMKIFKPSKSLSMLTELSREQEATAIAEIDVVCSGGGLKNYFMTGCVSILEHELAKRKVRIARVAGASAGAWAGLFICTGMGTTIWMETYFRFAELAENENATIHEAYTKMYREWVRELLPADAYKQCNKRLHISISYVTLTGLENRIVNEFTSNDDLIEACCASSTIPFITERYGLRRFRGDLVADGSFTNDIPVFKDELHRQLVFNLDEVDYSVRLRALPQDDCIEVFVLRGAMLMAQFLEGTSKSKAIGWLDRGETKTELELLEKNGMLAYIGNMLYNNKYKLFFSWWVVKYIQTNSHDRESWMYIVINAVATTCTSIINRLCKQFDFNNLWNSIIKLYS